MYFEKCVQQSIHSSTVTTSVMEEISLLRRKIYL